MPFANTKTRSRSSGRDVSETLMLVVSRYALWVVAVAALAITAYAVTDSFAEGARALIFFLVPSLWGAFLLVSLDTRPAALETMSASILNGMAAVAGVVIAAVFLLDAPVSIANLPLGIIEAAFFVMLVADEGRTKRIRWSETAQTIVRMVLILATVLCLIVAVAL
ncbi:MAG TPA: hypothetical protein VF228_20450 [Iamia sp.]